jgi:hypothetical protein
VRRKVGLVMPSYYFDLDRSAAAVARGQHRALVGGLWDALGRLQFDYLRRQGLRRDMTLLDVGCGCLRGGVHFVRWLDPGRYHGTDISAALLDAGHGVELAAAGLQDRLPRANRVCDGAFDMTAFAPKTFDMVLAVSVFTHLPLNHLRLCLARLVPVTRPGARFFASVFVAPDAAAWAGPVVHAPGGIVTRPDSDPYHMLPGDPAALCAGLPWRAGLPEDWGHPRDQRMVTFDRLPD